MVHNTGWSSNTSRNAFVLANNVVYGDIIRDISLSGLETIIKCLLDVINFGTEDTGIDIEIYKPEPSFRTFLAMAVSLDFTGHVLLF